MKTQKELDPRMKIYLLLAPGTDISKTIGFKAMGSGEVFTFGFSSPEKLTAFVSYHQQKGALGYLGNKITARWLTLQEYRDNPNNCLLTIDPAQDFPIDWDLPNLN